MVAVGLTTLSTCNYDLPKAVSGNRKLRVLCVGHGGGSLPLFLASKIQGADLSSLLQVVLTCSQLHLAIQFPCAYAKSSLSLKTVNLAVPAAAFARSNLWVVGRGCLLGKGAVIDIVEIDPLVISASINAMGFPSFPVSALPEQHALSRPTTIDEVLWRGIHERLFLYESDAEKFILDSNYLYDIIFIDAYDGDDIFPRKLWDPDSLFLETLGKRLHPSHGTVVVNLHSDADIVSPDSSTNPNLQPILPMGKYVSQVSHAYKDMVVGKKTYEKCQEQLPGLGFTVSVPWVCNTTLVVCRGFTGALNRDLVLDSLFSNSLEVEREMDLPFSCMEYLKRGFVLLD
ncbi:hypothetical protein KSS87_005476 [Heliosperma pusillum]|nr:hypothetical protein KSS87_005476 [Heliosperma pusillum]